MGNRVISQRLMELGERIRKRRQTLLWSQEKLAELLQGYPAPDKEDASFV